MLCVKAYGQEKALISSENWKWVRTQRENGGKKVGDCEGCSSQTTELGICLDILPSFFHCFWKTFQCHPWLISLLRPHIQSVLKPCQFQHKTTYLFVCLPIPSHRSHCPYSGQNLIVSYLDYRNNFLIGFSAFGPAPFDSPFSGSSQSDLVKVSIPMV